MSSRCASANTVKIADRISDVRALTASRPSLSLTSTSKVTVTRCCPLSPHSVTRKGSKCTTGPTSPAPESPDLPVSGELHGRDHLKLPPKRKARKPATSTARIALAALTAFICEPRQRSPRAETESPLKLDHDFGRRATRAVLFRFLHGGEAVEVGDAQGALQASDLGDGFVEAVLGRRCRLFHKGSR